MERLGSDELISIYENLHEQRDRESFSQVSKNFLKARCISIRRFYIRCPSLLNVILPGSPNLRYLYCFKPLSNEHMNLLAQSCPKLEKLDVPCLGYEFDFDDDGLCAVANACRRLYAMKLSGRLHVGDLGAVSLVRSLKNLAHLDLSRCVKITDESLKAIGEATCLKSLILHGCYLITDLGLEYLASGDLKNCLKDLSLAECIKISDAGIIHLKQMVNLYNLDLSKCGNGITNSGIFTIAEIQHIEILGLSWLINVSSEVLRALADLSKLSNLYLYSCHNISWDDVSSVPFTRLKYIGLVRV